VHKNPRNCVDLRKGVAENAKPETAKQHHKHNAERETDAGIGFLTSNCPGTSRPAHLDQGKTPSLAAAAHNRRDVMATTTTATIEIERDCITEQTIEVRVLERSHGQGRSGGGDVGRAYGYGDGDGDGRGEGGDKC